MAAAARLDQLRETAVRIEVGRSLLAGLVPAALVALALQVVAGDAMTQLVVGAAVFAAGWLVVGRMVGLAAARATLAGLPRLASLGLRRPQVSGR